MSLFEYLLMAIMQIANALLRAWNIRCISNSNKLMAHLSWQLYGMAFLVSLGLGIKSLAQLDWLGIVIWFASSGIGLEIGMKRK